MLTDQVRNDIDYLWEQLRNDGLVNNLTVLEQISYLLFARMLDMQEEVAQRNAVSTGCQLVSLFPADDSGQLLRWSNFKNLSDADELQAHLKENVYPYFAKLGKQSIQSRELGQVAALGSISEYIQDASLEVNSPSVLVAALQMVDNLPLTKTDIKGDIYEYLLSKLTAPGIHGQLLTPRYIIDAMVEMVDPQPTDVICDPACGTAGFLTRTMEYLNRTYSSENGIWQDDEGNTIYSGNLLEPDRQHINSQMFWGFDLDSTMVGLSSMNMMLHGVSGANIFSLDTLSKSIKRDYPQQEQEFFDVILANPPFAGSLDENNINPDLLSVVKTKRTEMLFLVHILRALKLGGRAAVIVPDNILYGSSGAHLQLRKELIENNQITGVISLHDEVFKTYAGLNTSLLFFAKGSTTKQVWFYDLETVGSSLVNKRTLLKGNDLSDAIVQWKQYQKLLKANASREDINQIFGDKIQKAFVVDACDIISNNYDLSIKRYKEEVFEDEIYEKPKVILQQLMSLEKEIIADLKALEDML